MTPLGRLPAIGITRRRRALLAPLVAAWPEPVATVVLQVALDAVASPSANPQNRLRGTLGDLRGNILRHGWTVLGTHRNGGGYRLMALGPFRGEPNDD